MSQAWRLFGVDARGILHSPMFGERFPGPRFTAHCVFDLEHVAPVEGCRCGVHAVTRRPAQHQLVKCGHTPGAAPDCRRWGVLAEVELYGPLLPDHVGATMSGLNDCSVRAGSGRIVSLAVGRPWTFEDAITWNEQRSALIAALEQRYGVPVTVR